jgi:predicted ATP-binding protein involved in virulence
MNMPNVDELELLKMKIERMNKTHHIEILKILKRFSNVKLNENKSGVYINLVFLPKDALEEMHKYVSYIEEQESSIMTLETQKEEYKNTYFSEKQNKEENALFV